jgi:ribosome maturation factor RimP
MDFLKQVKEYLVDVLKDKGLELYDLTYKREPSGYVLRVMVDGNQLTFNDLEYITKELTSWLDDSYVIKSKNYRVEVSSPGINKRLRNLEDYRKYVGNKCIILLKKGNYLNRKSIKGKILSVVNNIINIEENNIKISINYDSIKNSKLDNDIVF